LDVRFHGRVTRAQVAELLHATDLVAAPSVPTRDGRREGIPVALMEAMASGVPVVASRLSGIPELVDDERTGLLVPPGDAAALARAIGRLHADPVLRQRLAAAGRARVVEAFDLRTNAELLLEQIARASGTTVPVPAERV
jgi:glycosyltransferase involved in cell wall biosynthesis